MTGRVTPVFVQRLPSVPMQQTVVPRSLALPPDVPSFTGADCASDSSLGKICEVGVGVGVGAGVLEPPPHPTAPISTINPNKNPDIFAITISLLYETAALKSQAYFKFYAPLWPVNQSAGTSVMLDAESLLNGKGMCKLLNLRRFYRWKKKTDAPKSVVNSGYNERGWHC